jgi:hypothetical protein
MAEIGVVLLDIQKIPNNLGPVVDVSYTVTFDESDQRPRHRRFPCGARMTSHLAAPADQRSA